MVFAMLEKIRKHRVNKRYARRQIINKDVSQLLFFSIYRAISQGFPMFFFSNQRVFFWQSLYDWKTNDFRSEVESLIPDQ